MRHTYIVYNSYELDKVIGLVEANKPEEAIEKGKAIFSALSPAVKNLKRVSDRDREQILKNFSVQTRPTKPLNGRGRTYQYPILN